MYKKTLLFCLLVFLGGSLNAQITDSNDSAGKNNGEEQKLPPITYSLDNTKKYAIAGISVSGLEDSMYEDYVLIGVSGLSVGQKVSVPGDEITNALNALWRRKMFSDIQIKRVNQTADSVWLEIAIQPNPTISAINYSGMKNSEKEDLDGRIGVAIGSQINPNTINRIQKRTKDYFDEKGFSNAEVSIRQIDDIANKGKAILDINVDKKEKTKITEIIINGNESISDYDLKVAMKKTNEGFSLRKHPKLSIRKLFSSKKFVQEEFENDLNNILAKYGEKGYRDAVIASDSVVQVSDKHVKIYINIDEGQQYHIRDIRWVGNTKYTTDGLSELLNMYSGDVYNLKKLDERLMTDEDAALNIYHNSGYIFARMEPIETYVDNDSVDLEIRVIEGNPATVNRVVINGNDRIYEDIIRRELMTKPGQLFRKDVLMETYRSIAQMGHFDAEAIDIQPQPDYESGTVDIYYNLTSKANDQIEFSAGYGSTGITGKVSLKFTNFSVSNLLNPDTYKGIIPQGEGQTFTISGQTNGRYYQSYSASFYDPWFGGKRPNSFSLGAYYTKSTGIDSRFYNSSNYYYYDDYTSYTYDENKSIEIYGLSVGYGKRLSWPDNWFSLMGELTLQQYKLKNWGSGYFPINDGTCNSIVFGLTLSRNSTSNQLYPRSGSQFALSVQATPPYSLWDGVDYAALEDSDPKKHKWVEYHKWKFNGKIFIPLMHSDVTERGKVQRTPVLMGRADLGFVGSYNSNKRSAFETFYVGGDGMSGSYSYLAQETIAVRGYDNGSLTPNYDGYAYSRYVLELRYPFMLETTSTIYGLAFVEGGNAYSKVSDFNPFELKRSAGAGVRVFLPMVGLLGVDWAYGFDKVIVNSSAQRGGGRFHFILGQEF